MDAAVEIAVAPEYIGARRPPAGAVRDLEPRDMSLLTKAQNDFLVSALSIERKMDGAVFRSGRRNRRSTALQLEKLGLLAKEDAYLMDDAGRITERHCQCWRVTESGRAACIESW